MTDKVHKRKESNAHKQQSKSHKQTTKNQHHHNQKPTKPTQTILANNNKTTILKDNLSRKAQNI